MKAQITLNEHAREIWPTDPASRKLCTRLLGMYQIGYDYVPTTMGTVALKFRSIEEYEQALALIKNYEDHD